MLAGDVLLPPAGQTRKNTQLQIQVYYRIWSDDKPDSPRQTVHGQ